MGISVNVFNTNSRSVQVSVNNGPQFTIPPALASGGWTPGSASSGMPSWSNTNPAPNVLGPGRNSIIVTLQGDEPQQLQINLPGGMQWNDLQLYFAFNYGRVGWMVLNGGQFVAGGLPQ